MKNKMNKAKLLFLGIFFILAQYLFAHNRFAFAHSLGNALYLQSTIDADSVSSDTTVLSIKTLYQLPKDVHETSGLIYYEGSLWTINDSGNSPILYRLDSLDGSIRQTITLPDAENVDWESLAQDDENIYIGDFGNNKGDRDNLGIYIVKKSDIPENGDAEVESELISFTYSDYLKKAGWRDTDYDCEAMISVGDSLYLFSKNWVDNQTRLYRLAKNPGNQVAELQYTFNSLGLITGADFNPDVKEISLIGYTEDTFIPFLWLLYDYSDEQFFMGNKTRVNLNSLFGAQTEGITYTNERNGIISCEKSRVYKQSAFSISMGEPTDTGQNEVENSIFGIEDFVIKVNLISEGLLNIQTKGFTAGTYIVELYNKKGELQMKTECEIVEGDSECKLNFSIDSLQSGLYFVRLISDNVIIEKKFIKK